MKIIIFAGGSGTRLWPLSRQKLPKQFKRMFDGKSTIQLAVERVERAFGTYNIYISTNENYVSLVKTQLPQIPTSNIIGEPEKRDVAPAIGYNLIRLKKQGYSGPVAILWADHLMKNVENFVDVLKKGEDLIRKDPQRIVFIGEKPRYAENNLGWIRLGKEMSPGVYEYKEWRYRPDVADCKEMFAGGEWVWNPGYWLVDLDYVLSLYEEYLPEMYAELQKLGNAVGTVQESTVLKDIYPLLEKISFDKGIVEKIPADRAMVLTADLGWSDPGTLYALKEALIGNEGRNYTQGTTRTVETTDCLIINEEKNKLVVTLGLDKMVIVNTEDALLVVHKDNVREISTVIKEFENDESLKDYV